MVSHMPEAAISLDVATLFVIATCVSALLGLMLLAIWHQERVRALAWWGAAYLVGAFAVGLWGIDGAALLPAELPGALLFFACGMIWSAARLFHGRPILWVSMSAGSAAWLLASTFPLLSGPPERIVLSSVVISAYAFLTAWELWRERRKSLIRRWPALFVPILHGLVFLIPLSLGGLLPSERGLVALAGAWFAVFAVEAILYVVGTAFIVVILSKERAVRLHKTAASTDPLTGLFNRRAFLEGAQQLRSAQARKREPLGVLMFDLDRFKGINDRFGHHLGDEALKLFAATLSRSMRETDVVARWGGEEFAVLMPGSLVDAIVAGERIRLAFEAAGREIAGHKIGATVSIGAAAGDAAIEMAVLLSRADAALYRAKQNGRNRLEADAPISSERDSSPGTVPVEPEAFRWRGKARVPG
jgi:diguanylate cyclase (GGDEF)-like protein